MSRPQRLLNAYHDGELSGFSRWWLERRLRHSPALQRELRELEGLSGLLQTAREETAAEVAQMGEVWPGVVSGLAAIDARRRAATRLSEEERSRGWGWLRWPSLVAGAAAAAVVALVVVPALMRQALAPEPGASGTLRYLDTDGQAVMVSEGREETTIIWLMDPPSDAA
jgi:hypothetical protein